MKPKMPSAETFEVEEKANPVSELLPPIQVCGSIGVAGSALAMPPMRNATVAPSTYAFVRLASEDFNAQRSSRHATGQMEMSGRGSNPYRFYNQKRAGIGFDSIAPEQVQWSAH
jgi:hypothetical protein